MSRSQGVQRRRAGAGAVLAAALALGAAAPAHEPPAPPEATPVEARAARVYRAAPPHLPWAALAAGLAAAPYGLPPVLLELRPEAGRRPPAEVRRPRRPGRER